MDGKSDWMAFGLPVEGEAGPFAGQGVIEAATAGPDQRVSAVRAGRDRGASGPVVVINDAGVVLGSIESGRLDDAEADASASSIMALSPTTIRPSVELSSLAEAKEPVLITDSDGVLLGLIAPGSVSPPEDDDGAADEEMDQLQGTFLEIAHAVEEHFEGEDPSEEQVRSFLQDRLVDEGRTPEEAEAFLSNMERSAGDGGDDSPAAG